MSSRCEVCRKAFRSRFAKYRHKKRFAKGTKCNIPTALGRPKRQKIVAAAKKDSEADSHKALLSPMLDNNYRKNIDATKRREIKCLNKALSMKLNLTSRL